MFEKIVVKGHGINPLYGHLIKEKPEATSPNGSEFENKLKGYGISREHKEDILWNFEKFLIGKQGEVIARFNPDVTPDSPVIIEAIKSALK